VPLPYSSEVAVPVFDWDARGCKTRGSPARSLLIRKVLQYNRVCLGGSLGALVQSAAEIPSRIILKDAN
jgi:hypothetical protein